MNNCTKNSTSMPHRHIDLQPIPRPPTSRNRRAQTPMHFPRAAQYFYTPIVMSRGFIVVTALCALVALTAAQTFYISETFRGTQADCQAQKTSGGALLSYTATVIGKCTKRGNSYYKYDCNTTSATYYKNCRNSDCTNCQSLDSLSMDTCKASGSDWTTNRCGTNLLNGAEGVSSLDYNDNNCTDLASRDFRYASPACFVAPLFNTTFASSKATCNTDIVTSVRVPNSLPTFFFFAVLLERLAKPPFRIVSEFNFYLTGMYRFVLLLWMPDYDPENKQSVHALLSISHNLDLIFLCLIRFLACNNGRKLLCGSGTGAAGVVLALPKIAVVVISCVSFLFLL
jgi:hypothetical protein